MKKRKWRRYLFFCALVFPVSVFMYNAYVVSTFTVGSNIINDVSIKHKTISQKGSKELHRIDFIEKEGNTDDTVVWPSSDFPDNDRIINQLRFKPRWRGEKGSKVTDIKLKKILLFHGKEVWEVRKGRTTFLEQQCPVSTCKLTWNKSEISSADAVLFRNFPFNKRSSENSNQIWIYFSLESPYNTPALRFSRNFFNWTATYRHDSDIVAPYEKFQLYGETIKHKPQNRSYADGKTKLVAWFVSKCHSTNDRMTYAQELSKHIQVDIYGQCGTLKCNRGNSECSDMLKNDYKFYLAFENSNCRDYITEKFFTNSLQNDVIPIVMGAAPEDYARAAPYMSYIHVDNFQSPEHLAAYLHKLDQNDDLYNEYFRWKGTGRFINTYFWCRVCAMLHDSSRGRHVYTDLERWWRGESVCIGTHSWKDFIKTKPVHVDSSL